jgi:transcriptional regulator of aromatic amino acid metabolism
MLMNSPDVVSLSEAALLRHLTDVDRRPNLLVICTDVSIDTVVERLMAFCSPPYYSCSLPGALTLPSGRTGTLVLTDVEEMSLSQQITLCDWMSGDRDIQIVSVTSAPLRPLVESGQFLEGLFYRLNVVCLEATCQQLAAKVRFN